MRRRANPWRRCRVWPTRVLSPSGEASIIAAPKSSKRANGRPNLDPGSYLQMAQKGKKKKASSSDPNERVVTQNRKARHNYAVLDTLECGMVLVGSEVKSLRAGKASLEESYARVRDGEVWLLGCDIQEYVEANRFNHEPKRPRKLLLHRQEIAKFASPALQGGLTLVPLKLYFKDGKAKVLLGLCRGKQKQDKRETLRKNEARREIQQAMRRR